MSAAEAWPAANARECGRFELRLSAEGCAKIAAEYPLRCEGCEQLSGLPAVEPAAPAVAGRRSKMRPAVARQKSQRGGHRRAESIAQRKAEAAPPAPEPQAVETVTVVFSGEDAELVQRFAATSQQSGGELAADVAVVLGLFMDGVLVFKGGRKR